MLLSACTIVSLSFKLSLVLTELAVFCSSDKPEINTGLSNSTVDSWDDHQITLQCVAVGEPDPTFNWYNVDNREITDNVTSISNGTKVTLITKTTKDYGPYKCRATNVVGSTNHSITVNRLSEYNNENKKVFT